MAVWGIGSYYKNLSPKDRTKDYINDGCAYIGWNESEASALYRMLDSVKSGDIIYIKSFSTKKKNLIIKAVGIVTDTKKGESELLGTSIGVKWKMDFKPEKIDVTPEIYRNNVFNNTLYEEYNSVIIKKVIDAIFNE